RRRSGLSHASQSALTLPESRRELEVFFFQAEDGIRDVKEGREVPDDLREQYLKYRVNVRVLGVVRKDSDKLLFAASHRRLPHVGSKVAFLSQPVLREIAGHNVPGADLGFFALGEFIYAKGDKRLQLEAWM